MDYGKHASFLTALVLSLLFSWLYISTTPASVYMGDDGETISAANTLGIQHPPGYPLHTITAKAFSLIPAGDPSFRGCLFSVFLELACFLLAYLVSKLALDTAAIGTLSALTLSVAPAITAAGFTIWEQSIIAKGGIYIMNVLFTLSLTAVALVLYRDKARHVKYLFLFAFIYGLSLTHHHMSQEIALPAYAILLYRSGVLKKAGPRRIAAALLFFALGLSAYIYMPIRANTAVLNWGSPSTWDNFWMMVTRWQYVRSEITRSAAGSLTQAWKYMTSVSYAFAYAGILFAAVGMAVFYRKERTLFWYFVSIPVLFLGVTMVYLNLSKDRLYIMETYITPVYFPLALFACAGLIRVSEKLSSLLRLNAGAIEAVLLAALLSAQCVMFYPKLDKSRYFYVYDYCRNLLNTMDPQSVLFTTGDGVVFPTWYLKYVKKYRPDVTLAGSAVIPMQWVRDGMKKQNPNLRMPVITQKVGTESTGYIINAVIRGNIANFPVYFSYNKPEENSLGDEFAIVPKGIAQKVLPKQFARVTGQYTVMTDSMWKFYNLRGVFGRGRNFASGTSTGLYIKDYAVSLNSTGIFFEDNGMMDMALQYFTKAHYFDPTDHEFIYNMGNAAYNMGDMTKAAQLYRECLRLNPRYESGWYNLGVACYTARDYKCALESFRKVKELSPSRTDVDGNIFLLEKLAR
ncbi:MAG: DUF2723 domain-containing protein [Spirochaetia bacterium]|nr:DUF2723 domain-containing protein [Spirochaetia bacterium]